MDVLCQDLRSLLTSQLDACEYSLLLTTIYDLKTPDEAVKTCDWKSIKHYIKTHVPSVGGHGFSTLFYIRLCPMSEQVNNIFQCLAFYNNEILIRELEMYNLLSAKHCLDILLGASGGGHIDLIKQYSIHIARLDTEIYNPCLARAITHKQIDTILCLKNLCPHHINMYGNYFLAYGIIKGDLKLLDFIVNQFSIDPHTGISFMINQEDLDGIDYFLRIEKENDADETYESLIKESIEFAVHHGFVKSAEFLKSKELHLVVKSE